MEPSERTRVFKWTLLFLLPVIVNYAIIHEGAHVVAGVLQGEQVAGIQYYELGLKVLFSTPENARQGIKWGIIAISGITATLVTGYALLFLRNRWLSIRNPHLRFYFLCLTATPLSGDPFYYSIYPILGTGDIVGVSSFLGLPIVLVYLTALSLFVANMYLIRAKLRSELKSSNR